MSFFVDFRKKGTDNVYVRAEKLFGQFTHIMDGYEPVSMDYKKSVAELFESLLNVDYLHLKLADIIQTIQSRIPESMQLYFINLGSQFISTHSIDVLSTSREIEELIYEQSVDAQCLLSPLLQPIYSWLDICEIEPVKRSLNYMHKLLEDFLSFSSVFENVVNTSDVAMKIRTAYKNEIEIEIMQIRKCHSEHIPALIISILFVLKEYLSTSSDSVQKWGDFEEIIREIKGLASPWARKVKNIASELWIWNQKSRMDHASGEYIGSDQIELLRLKNFKTVSCLGEDCRKRIYHATSKSNSKDTRFFTISHTIVLGDSIEKLEYEISRAVAEMCDSIEGLGAKFTQTDRNHCTTHLIQFI